MNVFQKTMNEVGEKLNFARKTLMGPNNSIRDGQGFSYTSDRILTSVGNFLDMSSTRYTPISEAIARGLQQSTASRNFSATDMASVRDVDVADIAIASTVASHGLTYIAMERAMDNVGQQITFQGLRAMNAAGGFEAGAKVIDPRTSISPVVDFSRNGATVDTETTLDTSTGWHVTAATGTDKPIIIGTAELSIKVGSADAVVVAGDSGKNQPVKLDDIESGTGVTDASLQIWYRMNIYDGTNVAKAAVRLDTGVVAFKVHTALTASDKALVHACIDRGAQVNGGDTLKLKPYMESTELVATENRVILQTSLEVQAQMNKILRKNQQYGVTADFGKRAIDQVIQLYTYFIDLNIVRALYNGISHTPVLTLDLEGYATSGYTSFAATKNDRINQFVQAIGARFVSKTGSPMTAMIVDESAGLMLASDKESFVPDEALFSRRDGLIGTYNGIPVVRNAFLNERGSTYTPTGGSGTAHKGIVIAVFKSADGTCGPVAQGDYLPPYSTLPAINSNNPSELSQALFSQTATKCVVPEWAMYCEVKPFVG